MPTHGPPDFLRLHSLRSRMRRFFKFFPFSNVVVVVVVVAFALPLKSLKPRMMKSARGWI